VFAEVPEDSRVLSERRLWFPTSYHLQTWLILSGTTWSRLYHESTMVWPNLPPCHRFLYFVLLFSTKTSWQRGSKHYQRFYDGICVITCDGKTQILLKKSNIKWSQSRNIFLADFCSVHQKHAGWGCIFLMVYRNKKQQETTNAGSLGAGFISGCLETRWLGHFGGFYGSEPYCTGFPWMI